MGPSRVVVRKRPPLSPSGWARSKGIPLVGPPREAAKSSRHPSVSVSAVLHDLVLPPPWPCNIPPPPNSVLFIPRNRNFIPAQGGSTIRGDSLFGGIYYSGGGGVTSPCTVLPLQSLLSFPLLRVPPTSPLADGRALHTPLFTVPRAVHHVGQLLSGAPAPHYRRRRRHRVIYSV